MDNKINMLNVNNDRQNKGRGTEQRVKKPLMDEYMSKYQGEVYDLNEAAEVVMERMLRLEEVQGEDRNQGQHENIGSKAGEQREQQRHTEQATLRRAKGTTGCQDKKKKPGIGQPQYRARMRDNKVMTACQGHEHSAK